MSEEIVSFSFLGFRTIFFDVLERSNALDFDNFDRDRCYTMLVLFVYFHLLSLNYYLFFLQINANFELILHKIKSFYQIDLDD